MKKIALIVFLLSFMMIGTAFSGTSRSVSAIQSGIPSIQGEPTEVYFVEGYVDVLYLSFHGDKLVHGYDYAEGYYYAPILGMWGATGWLLFIDFPTDPGLYELMMMIVHQPNLNAEGWLTVDGLTVDGPGYYQLIPGKAEKVEGAKTLGSSVKAEQVEPALVGFWLRPWIDECWLAGLNLSPLPVKGVKGYLDVEGYPGYPAPILGVVTAKKLIFAGDYKTYPGYYELRLMILDKPGLHGVSYPTVDGITVYGPDETWLERM